jgi:hypothetical protein
MAITVATGARIEFGSALGTSVTMSAITNGTEAVATLGASHAIVENDYMVVTSGWGLLDGRAVRADSVGTGTATNEVTFENIDTSSTTRYTAGQGTGSIKEVSTWVEITQVATIETSGGDQNFADSSSLVDVDDKQIPTARAATTYTLNLHDDASLAFVPTLRSVADAGTAMPMRITFPSGAKFLANGYWSFQENPTFSRTETTKTRVVFTTSARPVKLAD